MRRWHWDWYFFKQSVKHKKIAIEWAVKEFIHHKIFRNNRPYHSRVQARPFKVWVRDQLVWFLMCIICKINIEDEIFTTKKHGWRSCDTEDQAKYWNYVHLACFLRGEVCVVNAPMISNREGTIYFTKTVKLVDRTPGERLLLKNMLEDSGIDIYGKDIKSWRGAKIYED